MPLTVDDAQLLRMAAEPPRDAARMLHRSRTFAPLLTLLAVVLPLLTAANSTFEADTARWGLKALAVARAEQIPQILIPGLLWHQDTTLFQPPLQAWLTCSLISTSPPGGIGCLFAISVVSLMLGVWCGAVWARESAGSPYGLMFAAIISTHPQWLTLAASGASDALTACLLTAAGWAIWSHWRTAHTQVSLRLLGGGLAWGLAILSGGILAFAFLAVVVAWGLLFLPAESPEASEQGPSVSFRRRRTLAIVFATGMALGGWWIALMLEEYGLEFLRVWTTHSAGLDEHLSRAQRVQWRDDLVVWLERSAFLSGFLLLGIGTGLRSLLSRNPSPPQQFAGFMVCWLGVGVAMRLLPGLVLDVWGLQSSRAWESFCIVPAAYLAAHGVVEMTQRRISTRWMLTCLTITVGCVAGTLTERWQAGLIIGGTVGTVLAASAPLAMGLRRTSLAWSESEVRRWIQGFGVIALLGHAAMGALIWRATPTGRNIYEGSRSKLSRIASPDHVSLVTSDEHDGDAQLEYLLRSVFPSAQLSHAVGWDSELTNIIVTEAEAPRSRMLIVEWSRKELKVGGDVGTGWRVTPVLDPVPYRGRRIAAIMIEPERSRTFLP